MVRSKRCDNLAKFELELNGEVRLLMGSYSWTTNSAIFGVDMIYKGLAKARTTTYKKTSSQV
jgi:hypothetical protein